MGGKPMLEEQRRTLEKATQTIHRVLQEHLIRVERIMLFGSRARGQARPDSDWDFYVLVDRDLAFAEKRYLVTAIKRELARQRIPNDVLLCSMRHFQATRKYPGHLAYEVHREGLIV